MKMIDLQAGKEELRAARGDSRSLYLSVFVFSLFVNLLMLTGPLYMLQVYDRVLGSRSEETLIALSALVVFLFTAMGFLDHARGRVMARVGARFQDRLDRRVFQAALQHLTLHPDDSGARTAQHDLEAVQRLLGSPVLIALFDLLWTPLFILAIFVFHPVLGWLAVGGGAFLIGITLFNQAASRVPMQRFNLAARQADRVGESLRSESETVQALGMHDAGFARWQAARATALAAYMTTADRTGLFSVTSRTLRLFLQSAMLGAGALLVLRGELGAGAMIAGSILLGRALAPVELIVGQWAVVLRAREGWIRLATLLSMHPAEGPRTALPRPRPVLDVQSLIVAPPGSPLPVLHRISFQVVPGQALGVIGASGSGKSTLARALTGAWPPAGGTIRLDGATLDQYDPGVLGGYIGYLPQRVSFFDGTIAENIARLQQPPDAIKVVEAAKKAAAHDMILKLPAGYDTRISTMGARLSGGQMQRIGLARALFDAPVLLVLDEPDSSLDNDGSVALRAAIRRVKAEGGAVLIMAHRPASIQECDVLMVLEDGILRAFGPRDQVLRDMVRNHTDIVRNFAQGGAG